jgi:hypothetical protein
MNMLKAYVDVCWELYWEEMVKALNYKSDTALKYARKVNDHHKGWTQLCIAREAVTDELLVPYVRHIFAQHSEPSVEGFLKYTMTAQNSTYTLMCDMAFELMDAIFMFRAGVRSGYLPFISAARGKFAKIWSARNHPLYRELEVADSLLLQRMPPEVRDFVTNSMSMNLKGIPYTAQGADFRLEEINKKVQQWLPKNPKPKDWQMVCSNFEMMTKIRDTTFGEMGIQDPGKEHSEQCQDISLEVREIRSIIRNSNILNHPQELDMDVHSVSGKLLCQELKSICTLGRQKRIEFVSVYRQKEKYFKDTKPAPVSFSTATVCVTTDEKIQQDEIASKTVKEIKAIIESSLAHITDQEEREALSSVWYLDMKSSNKSDLGPQGRG